MTVSRQRTIICPCHGEVVSLKHYRKHLRFMRQMADVFAETMSDPDARREFVEQWNAELRRNRALIQSVLDDLDSVLRGLGEDVR